MKQALDSGLSYAVKVSSTAVVVVVQTVSLYGLTVYFDWLVVRKPLPLSSLIGFQRSVFTLHFLTQRGRSFRMLLNDLPIAILHPPPPLHIPPHVPPLLYHRTFP